MLAATRGGRLDRAMDEDQPRKSIAHEIGGNLDTLSVRDFDARIALLQAEIVRLQAAKSAKQAALDAAGSVFGRPKV